MTPTTLAETILRDVPRFDIYEGDILFSAQGTWVTHREVLAALTAALDGVDERAGEVLSRLRKADEYEPLGHDGWEAADLITALLAQNAALRAERDQAVATAQGDHELLVAAEAVAEKLRGALEAIYEITVEPAETDHKNVRGWIEVTARAALTTEADHA